MKCSLPQCLNSLSMALTEAILAVPSDNEGQIVFAYLTEGYANRFARDLPTLNPISALALGRQVAPLPICYEVRFALMPHLPIIQAIFDSFDIADPDQMALQVATLMDANLLKTACDTGMVASAQDVAQAIEAAEWAYSNHRPIAETVGKALIETIKRRGITQTGD